MLDVREAAPQHHIQGLESYSEAPIKHISYIVSVHSGSIQSQTESSGIKKKTDFVGYSFNNISSANLIYQECL